MVIPKLGINTLLAILKNALAANYVSMSVHTQKLENTIHTGVVFVQFEWMRY